MFFSWFVGLAHPFVSISVSALISLPLHSHEQPHPCPALEVCVFPGFFLSLITCVLSYSSPALQHTKSTRQGCAVFSCLTPCGFGLSDSDLFQVLGNRAGHPPRQLSGPGCWLTRSLHRCPQLRVCPALFPCPSSSHWDLVVLHLTRSLRGQFQLTGA